MSTRSMLVLGLCLIACCLILGKSFGDAPAQPQVGQVIPGRYQLVSVGGTAVDHHVVLFDTATGRCWLKNFDFRGSEGRWHDQGSPAEKPAKK